MAEFIFFALMDSKFEYSYGFREEVVKKCNYLF